MHNNDKIILELQEVIRAKKNNLAKNKPFSPVTNCILKIYDKEENIHVMDKNTICLRLAQINSLQISLEQVLPGEELIINGYNALDWIKDLTQKFHILNINTEKERLKKLEDKLKDLLSFDTQVSLKLDEIKGQI